MSAHPQVVEGAGTRTPGIAGRRATEVTERLAKIEGQVSGIGRMYDQGRYCVDVLDQIAAARAGLQAAALIILEDHVTGCVREAKQGAAGAGAPDELQQKAGELVDVIRRLVRGG